MGGDAQREMRNKNLIRNSVRIEGVPEEMGADEVAQGVNKKSAKEPPSASLQLQQQEAGGARCHQSQGADALGGGG